MIFFKFFILYFLSGGSVFAGSLNEYRVWVDGIYDMAHYGHQRSFEKARNAAAEHFNVHPEAIKVVVGVNGGDIKSYKREPAMNLEQRANQIRSFKGVDEVIEGTDLVFNVNYLERYKIDLVMHGDDYTEEKIQKYYPGLSEVGKFKTYPYEDGISTTQITKRATKLTLEALLEKNSVNCAEKEAVRQVLILLEREKI